MPERTGQTISHRSSVAAIVPHYHCEAWLAGCLESLVNQTRPLDAIVVVDDASGAPPIDIVQRFPQVTLLESERNVGPFCLTQTVIDACDFDAYMHQDADDWSSTDRLEALLAEAERTGAELVSCQEVRIFCALGEVRPFRHPRNVNRSMEHKPYRQALLHPGSIVGAGLMKRLGGLATGLRFAGDLEFLLRATRVAKVRSTSRFCYYRRIRDGALTSSPETGRSSLARHDLYRELRRWHQEMSRKLPDEPWPPYRLAEPVALRHVTGPRQGWD